MLAQVLSRLTEYFTSTETAPVQEIAEATRTGPATAVLSGISSRSRVERVGDHRHRRSRSVSGIWLGDGNIQFSFYLVALTGMGMLATTGVIVSEDTFGPVADNAAGIAEMSGEFEGEPERIMVSLDAVGNTTKAVTKGFAIGSAVIASVALFASYIETIGGELEPLAGVVGNKLFNNILTQINVANPKRVHRTAHRRLDRVPLLGARDPSGRAHRGRGRAGGAQPVRRRQDHGRYQEARLRPGHRHLHRGVAA